MICLKVDTRTEESLLSSLNTVVRDNISHGAFVSSVDRIDSKSYLAQLGLVWAETFCDDRTGECVVKYLRNDRLGALDVTKGKSGYCLTYPSREFVVDVIGKNLDSSFVQSENAILKSTEERLARIPQVQTSMSVLHKIVRYVHEQNSITIDQIPCRSSKRKSKAKRANQYMQLLSDLRIVKRENSHYVPGSRMRDLAESGSPMDDVFTRIMGEIYSRGYAYMRKELHLTGVVPYLRTTHSYYLPVHKYGKLLAFNGKSMAANLANYYPMSRKYMNDLVTVNNWLFELHDAQVMKKQEECFTGREEIRESYEQNMKRFAVMASTAF